MRYLVYQESVQNVTYSLYARNFKKEYIYDIEVKTLVKKNNRTKMVKSISTDCQTSMLLLEMLIEQKILIDELIMKKQTFQNCENLCLL